MSLTLRKDLNRPLTIEEMDNNFETLASGSSSPSALPYKVYTALLTQPNVNAAPIANILENTLGGTPTYGYEDDGWYTISLAGNFPINLTTAIINSTNPAFTLSPDYENGLINIYSYNTSTQELGNGGINTPTFIEIRVYNAE
jgi:hypothetical protein